MYLLTEWEGGEAARENMRERERERERERAKTLSLKNLHGKLSIKYCIVLFIFSVPSSHSCSK